MSEQSTTLEQLAPNLEVMKNLAVSLLDELNEYQDETKLAYSLVPTWGESKRGIVRGDMPSQAGAIGVFQQYWESRGIDTLPSLPNDFPDLKQIEEATSGHIVEAYIRQLWDALRFVRLVRDGGNDVTQSSKHEIITVEGTDTERVPTIGDDVRTAVAKIIPILGDKSYVGTAPGKWIMGMSYTIGYKDLQKPAIEARLAIFAQQLDGVEFDKERLTLTVDVA